MKRHRWFRSIDWDAVPQRRLKVYSAKCRMSQREVIVHLSCSVELLLPGVSVFMCVYAHAFLIFYTENLY